MVSPAASGSAGVVPADPVRALQHALYRAAKADPGRRFHALHDKIIRSDVLWGAWVAVCRNNGAPGIDKIPLPRVDLPRAFRTAYLQLIYAVDCRSTYPSWACRGLRY